jgi:hypothetical protein
LKNTLVFSFTLITQLSVDLRNETGALLAALDQQPPCSPQTGGPS